MINRLIPLIGCLTSLLAFGCGTSKTEESVVEKDTPIYFNFARISTYPFTKATSSGDIRCKLIGSGTYTGQSPVTVQLTCQGYENEDPPVSSPVAFSERDIFLLNKYMGQIDLKSLKNEYKSKSAGAAESDGSIYSFKFSSATASKQVTIDTSFPDELPVGLREFYVTFSSIY